MYSSKINSSVHSTYTPLEGGAAVIGDHGDMEEDPRNRFLVMGTYYPVGYTADARGLLGPDSHAGDLAIYMSQKALREMDVSKLYIASDTENPHGVYEKDPKTGKERCVKGPPPNGRPLCDFTDAAGNRKVVWMTMGTEEGIAQARDIITGAKKELSLAHKAELWQYPDRQEIVYTADHIAVLPGDVAAGREGCHIEFIAPISPENTLMKDIRAWIETRKNKEHANERFKELVEKLKGAVVTTSTPGTPDAGSVTADEKKEHMADTTTQTSAPAAATPAADPAPAAAQAGDATMTDAAPAELPPITSEQIASATTLEELTALEEKYSPKTDEQWNDPEMLTLVGVFKSRRAEILAKQLEEANAAAKTTQEDNAKLREELKLSKSAQLAEVQRNLDQVFAANQGSMTKDMRERLSKTVRDLYTNESANPDIRYLVKEMTCAASRNPYLAAQEERTNFGAAAATPTRSSFQDMLRSRTSTGSHFVSQPTADASPTALPASTLGKRAAVVPDAKKRAVFSDDSVVNKWLKPNPNLDMARALRVATTTAGFVQPEDAQMS